MSRKLILLALVLFTLAFPVAGRADGIIIPDPCIDRPCPPPPCPVFPCPPPSPMAQLAIRYHRVDVTIEDQVAVTHVDQVFFNPNDYPVEGIYLFPLPPDAAVSSFTLWVDGKPVEGQVLDAETARSTYEEIVRGLRDPALLEYAGRGAMRASIFPIPPQGERRIELEYTQALAAENGLVRYVYPLSTEKFSVWPLENVSIHVEVRSSLPIRAVYSPSHPVAIDRQGPNRVIAGYEDQNVLPDADFALYYSLGEEQAFHLLTYQDPGDELDQDGFFLMLLAPRPDATSQAVPKDVLLVLDRSGSMEGEKFQQAQEALRYILRHLNPGDRFNLIAFSTGMEAYAQGLRQSEEANEAIAWVDRLSAQGSTDIHRALLEAAGMLSESGSVERPAYVIFLTDGLPTEGVVDSQQILDGFAAAAPKDLRLFSFGVGYDVDTYLLDSLAQSHHGTSSYVLPGERLDEALSSFYAKISTPVLTDLQLDFGDLAVYDLFPEPLPDLFLGSQIVLVGRYREGGRTEVTLTGKVNGQTQTFRYPDQQFGGLSQAQAGDPLASIPRLWATRKVGHLLSLIRLNGPDQETIDQIVKLSIRYGIVTPYTSYLVTEEQPLGAAEQERIAGEQLRALQATGTPPASGQAAVQKSADQSAMAGAAAPSAPEGSASGSVRVVGARTFVLNGEVWTDTAFDPDSMETVKVSFLSDDYFALANAYPELAAAFALGERVIVLQGKTVYEVVGADEETAPVSIPTPTIGETEAVSPRPSQTAAPARLGPPTIEPGGSTQPAVGGEPIAPGGMPCAGALLAGIPFAVIILRRRYS